MVIFVFLDQAYERRERRALSEGRGITRQELIDAVIEGALLRVRPKSHDGRGHHRRAPADHAGQRDGSVLMRRIAGPMVGGMASAAVLTLVVIPA